MEEKMTTDKDQAEAYLKATVDSLRSLGAMADALESIVHALRQCAALARIMAAEDN